MTNSTNGVGRTHIVDADGHQVNVYPDGSIPVTSVPEGATFYAYSVAEVPGTVAANTYLSLFNPVGSGKSLIVYQVIIAAYSTGAATTTNNLQTFRTTAHSGGTLITGSAISKFVTATTNSTAEVRIGNPSVTTTGAVLLAIPPAITSAGSGAGSDNAAVPAGASFLCAPGEGIAFKVAAGNTNQLWNVNVTWAEI